MLNARDDAQHRGFARPIDTDERDMLAFKDLERDIAEDLRDPKMLCEILD
jgi:hypothetical protein